ncbi:tetratricopeptide repeat protein [Dactylosporangium cerinum]|uniref:Tetratricopeptide repeat protein n=1 Tax=Dactylosporangium cerinum TaxID=1434730 RepID=A0ABV9W3I4_9ACTN
MANPTADDVVLHGLAAKVSRRVPTEFDGGVSLTPQPGGKGDLHFILAPDLGDARARSLERYSALSDPQLELYLDDDPPAVVAVPGADSTPEFPVTVAAGAELHLVVTPLTEDRSRVHWQLIAGVEWSGHQAMVTADFETTAETGNLTVRPGGTLGPTPVWELVPHWRGSRFEEPPDPNAPARRDEELAAAAEACQIYRVLSESDPTAYLPNLARALGSLAGKVQRHADVGKLLPDLARTLAELRAVQLRLGDAGAAVQAGLAAHAICRQLAEADPQRHTDGLAAALRGLVEPLVRTGEYEAAWTAGVEALALLRRAGEPTEEQLPGIAGIESNVGLALLRLDRHEEALDAQQRALQIRRQLATADPGHRPDLALSLVNLVDPLLHLGRADEAADAAREASDIYRALAEVDPGEYTGQYAASLTNLGSTLARVGRPAEGLATLEQAASTYRDLAGTHPEHAAHLAITLYNLANGLADEGRTDDAVLVWTEAGELVAPILGAADTFARTQLSAVLDGAAAGLLNAGRTCADEEPARALTLLDGAVQAYRVLTDADGRRRAALADALLLYTVVSASYGLELQRGLAAGDEAIEHYAQLIGDPPDPEQTQAAQAALITYQHLVLILTGLGRDEEAAELRRDLDAATRQSAG